MHVDGDHTETGCYADLQHAADVVAPGGFILVNDYDNIHTVRTAADRFIAERAWPSLYLPTPHGDVLIRKPAF